MNKIVSISYPQCSASNLEVLEYFRSRLCKVCLRIPTPSIRNKSKIYDFYCYSCFNQIDDEVITQDETEIKNLRSLIISCYNYCGKSFFYEEIESLVQHEHLCSYQDKPIELFKIEKSIRNRICNRCNVKIENDHDCINLVLNKLEVLEKAFINKSLINENNIKILFNKIHQIKEEFNLSIEKLKIENENLKQRIREEVKEKTGKNTMKKASNLKKHSTLKNELNEIRKETRILRKSVIKEAMNRSLMHFNNLNHDEFMVQLTDSSPMSKFKFQDDNISLTTQNICLLSNIAINKISEEKNNLNVELNILISNLESHEVLKTMGVISDNYHNQYLTNNIQELKNDYHSIENLFESISNLNGESESEIRLTNLEQKIEELHTKIKKIKDSKEFCQEKQVINGHNSNITCIIESSNDSFVTSSEDHSIKIWTKENNYFQLKKSFDNSHTNHINALLIKNSGKLLISGSHDCFIKFWDLITLEKLKSNEINLFSPILSIEDHKPNLIICGLTDSTIRIIDVENKSSIFKLIGHNGIIWKLLMLNDKNRLVSGSTDKSIKVWDLENKKCISTFKKHEKLITSLIQLSYDENVILSAGFEGKIIFWDILKSTFFKVLEIPINKNKGNYVCLKELKEKKTLVSGSFEGYLSFWNLNNFELIRHIQINQGIYCISQIQEGSLIFNVSKDIIIWE